MIADLCNKILEEPRAIDIKTLIEEVKRVGIKDITLEETMALVKVADDPTVLEEYADLIDELKVTLIKLIP